MDVADIKYPVRFHFFDIAPKYITFWSKGAKGVYDTGTESDLKISYFVSMHNKVNPTNNPGSRYYCECSEDNVIEQDNDCLTVNLYGGGKIKINKYTENQRINICSTGEVEHMPIGATLHAIQRKDGEWQELRFKPDRVEVHEDNICLLSGYSGFSKKALNYSAEINIKRGTKIKYSTNC